MSLNRKGLLRLAAQAMLAVIFFVGCGSSDNFVVTNPPTQAGNTVTFNLDASQGGDFGHPLSGHGVTFPANSVDQDGVLTLSLVNPVDEGLPQTGDFKAVGTAVKVELGSSRLLGSASFRVPFSTTTPQTFRLYWKVPQGPLVPLETTYDSTSGSFRADVTAIDEVVAQANSQAAVQPQSVVVSLVDESGFLSRPAHTNWSSYNLYVFTNGSFQKVLDQGQPVPGTSIPAPGDRPLMIVHGLGSNIPRFQDAATYLRANGNFTTIYGFEYDTLSGLAPIGPMLQDAYNRLDNGAGLNWFHLAHSMGCLVSRQAFESASSPNYSSNRVVFAAGPHLGSQAINVLQGSLSISQQFVRYMVVNEVLDFTNADGTPCQVDLQDQGFSDLAVGSSALATLNQNAAGNHPQESYRTLGGNDRGLEYDFADFVMGTYLDDGLVNLSSANPGALIGALDSAVVPESHSSIVEDASNSLPKILQFLTP